MSSSGDVKTEVNGVGKTLADVVVVPSATRQRHYLLVFHGETSRMVELPRSGEVVVGRATDVPISIEDRSISRQHARLTLSDGLARLSDLESQNGTFLNGERIVGSAPLASGDTVTVGSATLVYHSSHREVPRRPLLETAAFRRRLEEELERATRHERPLTVIAILLEQPSTDGASLVEQLDRHCRLGDVLGGGGTEPLLVLLPELGADEAPEACRRLVTVVRRTARRSRAGHTSYPIDGCDADTLVAGARAAANAAEPGGLAAAASTFRRHQLGSLEVIVAEPAMIRLYGLVERLAASDISVLVQGETGTGKELVAGALHEWSARKTGPLVAFNCAAIPENLVESELFGHAVGAFTGATGAKPGLIETAHRGTLHLDEIGELSPAVQSKLLRVLESKRVTRLGETREREIDVRLVASTNRNLQEESKAGRFRQDLFFRVSGGMLWLPPLRDRPRELAILAQKFLGDACRRHGREPPTMSDGAMRQLAQHEWPGNVRELRNLMDYLAATVSGPVVDGSAVAERLGLGEAPPSGSAIPAAPSPSGFRPIDEEIRELEKIRMTAALEAAQGNQTRAAELIRMPLRTFQAKVKQYDLSRRRER